MTKRKKIMFIYFAKYFNAYKKNVLKYFNLSVDV